MKKDKWNLQFFWDQHHLILLFVSFDFESSQFSSSIFSSFLPSVSLPPFCTKNVKVLQKTLICFVGEPKGSLINPKVLLRILKFLEEPQESSWVPHGRYRRTPERTFRGSAVCHTRGTPKCSPKNLLENLDVLPSNHRFIK